MVDSGLTALNWGMLAPGDNDHLYVSDQNGILWKINLLNGETGSILRAFALSVEQLCVVAGISEEKELRHSHHPILKGRNVRG